jgi:GntR family carbon starvation induced transcriptional regulator
MNLAGKNRKTAKATRASSVADALRSSILFGELKPGTKVNLDQMRTHFGVSLSPLRDALARLVNTGLVELEDQRGYRIAPVSVENLAEVTRLTADIECLALGYAIDDAALDWESNVLGALHRLNRAAQNVTDAGLVRDREMAHAAFHSTLIAGCGMPILIEFCGTLRNLTDRYRRLYENPHSLDVAEHTAIAEAAAVNRDRKSAQKLLRTHYERTGADLAEKLAAQLQGVT